MKRFVFLVVLSVSGLNLAYSQMGVTENERQELFSQTPQEQLFIHYNTSVLFAGEYLYYSLYCLNSDTGLLSDISKIAYVELIGEEGTSFFRHKLQLDNGLGEGDFFVPTSLPSGNYKLIGYTQWMGNGGQNDFFSADIAVVNPYRGDQSAIMADAPLNAERKEKQISMTKPSWQKEDFQPRKDKNLQVSISAAVFGSREKVLLWLKSSNGNSGTGTYSLSVRKVDSINSPKRFSFREIGDVSLEIDASESSQAEALLVPELRGDLLSGRIRPRNPDQNSTVAGRKIALSIPGENFAFKVATTDEMGVFFFNIMEDYPQSQALLQLIGNNKEDFDISLESDLEVDVSLLEFGDFQITPQMNQEILQRSIYNQIENAYYSAKPDTLKPRELADPFYGSAPEIYDLDEYTRFQTIRETFIEIIKAAWVTKNREGEPVFEVRRLEGAIEYGLPPLLLVDGAMVQDHGQFLEYPAKGVQRIGILRNNFYVGSHIFQGIITVETLQGDYFNSLQKDYLKRFELKKPQPEKSYFQQTYNDSIPADHIPDFRSQLLWIPSFQIESKKKEVTFFTSDNQGLFEISVEGFTEGGEPVFVKEYIRVK